MKLNESMKLLNDLKIGRGDLCIKIPGPSEGSSGSSLRTYELNGSRISEIMEALDTDLKKGLQQLKGVVVFGSSVCASYQTIKHKYLFGFIQLKRKHLIYEKGRRPNDVDLMIIVDDAFDKMVDEFPEFVSTDIKASYYCSDGYSGKCQSREIRKKELDLVFITESQLIERHEAGDQLINHVETAGVLALGDCPIKLKGAAFFSANKRNLSLTFPTI